MIDSITLRIVNLSKYERVKEALEDLHRGTSVSRLDFNRKDLKSFIDIKFMDFHSDRKQKMYYKGWVTIPTSEYDCMYTINTAMDYVEFKFSVPKMCYGTNITQLIPHHSEFDASQGILAGFSMKENGHLSFIRLRRFIKMFIEMLVVDPDIAPHDIQVVRMDLCFNQIFDTPEQARMYLDMQKRVRKRYVRDSTKEKHSYRSSIYIVTEDYTAKIYLKGVEYEKFDMKKHKKINDLLGYEKFKIEDRMEGGRLVEGLKSISNRILRYELEFKNSYMSKIYMENIFRRKCTKWKVLKTMSRKLKAYDDLMVTKYKYKRTHTAKEYEEYLERIVLSKYFPYTKLKDVKMSLPEQKLGKLYDEYVGKSVRFCYDVSENRRKYNEMTPRFYNYLEDKEEVRQHKAKLGNHLWAFMYNKFRDFFMQYQLKGRSTLDEVGDLIAKYNKTVQDWNRTFPEDKKRKINGKKIMVVIALLGNYTLDELVKNGIISRQSKWELEQKFKKIGFDSKSIMPDNINVSLDYERYKLLFYECEGVIPTESYFFK